MNSGNIQHSFYTLIEEIKDALQVMARWGSEGFDCSSRGLETVMNWGDKQINSFETLEDVRREIGNCRRCRLAEKRKHLVFGEGHSKARIVFVGEGPGYEEDKQGRPFVGAAGQLLTKIIDAMQLKRDQVYICNIIKCRPPKNRNPEPDEITTCFPFLERQIQAIQPDIICALGTFAAQTLLKTNVPISGLRGRFHQYGDTRVMPTYHPAYLLRNPAKKRDTWDDVQQIMKALGLK
jgi:DNA polymerase